MTEHERELAKLRARMTALNKRIMTALNEFITLYNRIGEVKNKIGLPHFDPVRESQLIKEVLDANPGPMPSEQMKEVFRAIFSASVEDTSVGKQVSLEVTRLPGSQDQVVRVGGADGVRVGGGRPALIGGPCSVESYEQMLATAKGLKALGVPILRGGAFKPRTSPYSFQGLEEEGLKTLRAVGDNVGMPVVTEVISGHDVELVARYADMLQVGTRNMFNYALLKELGHIDKPVLLKRGFMATMEEFVLAAEYIYMRGNHQIVLCERGIRTFETWTRNTLDISSVPILKQETLLPVVVDISHALGRKDVIAPIAHAALVAGADGLMFECHHNPAAALSDSHQQLDLAEAARLIDYLRSRVEINWRKKDDQTPGDARPVR
jgi:3-deoxy-7-phosphoheptulonate synthase/chorismate mutase